VLRIWICKKRWAEHKVYESMAAAIGVKGSGEILSLDIHEKFHGPHGLVAGTTGSGKSELLQTYILSLTLNFHPYEVGFIIIDFKGGGMANQFQNLPHLNGCITNIDGKQINRSLLSIKAELLKRQELFAKYNVNKIDDYIKLYRSGECADPLPHLIIIVDEFAELKSEQPDFMKELISAARIGRSLGVHLILATQKPSGVVNDQIWSNSRFKLCLKVQDKSDSNEMIKSPLASEIREAGRAYFQVGNNEIFELFQSAYSGAAAKVQSTDSGRKFSISKVSLSGDREVIYSQNPKKSENVSKTQLDALVGFIDKYCNSIGLKKLPNICLRALSNLIMYPAITNSYLYENIADDSYGEVLENADTNSNIIILIGIYDDSSRQYQGEVRLDFTNNHMFILGSSLSGKTYMLQSMIYGLCAKYTPSDVNIYVLDFASMIMKNFERLAHVGCVITQSEDDKLVKFMNFMMQELEDRRRLISNLGLSSYSAYRESGYRDIPQIVILIDDYSAFKMSFPGEEEKISNICRDGVSLGISVVVTSKQLSCIGYKMMTYFSEKIALHCNDRSQYMSLIDRCKIVPDETAGRGVMTIGTDVYEFQTYVSFYAEKEVLRNNKINEFVEIVNKKIKRQSRQNFCIYA